MIGKHTSTRGVVLWTALSLFFFLFVLTILYYSEDVADVKQVAASAPMPLVSTIDVKVSAETVQISTFAEVKPRWVVAIRAAVSGRIVQVHDQAFAGSRVQKGATLFSLEKAEYEAAVVAAQLGLEESRLALWQAEKAVTLAADEFKRAGTDAPNDFALRLPQLSIARSRVSYAEARVKAAEQALLDTEVVAPFTGVITVREASLGQTVERGEALVQLSSSQNFEITAELNDQEWGLLSHPLPGTRAILTSSAGRVLGEAVIRDAGGYLDKDTRQRKVHLTAASPGSLLLAGDFVRVQFAGRTVENAVRLPESSLSREGNLWRLDESNRLEKMSAQPIFRTDGDVIVAAPKDTVSMRFALTPLTSFLPGLRVSPQPIDS